MNRDVLEYVSQDEGELMIGVARRMGIDIHAMAEEIDLSLKQGKLGGAIRVQWRFIGSLTRMVAHLEKQNALMESDYVRQGKGRNSQRKM